MPTTKLEDALQNCLINFDRRVLLTDLLQEYDLPYELVNEVLEKYLCETEAKGEKYEKRFLVHGQMEEDGRIDEMFTIVQGEPKMKEWLLRLNNAQATLYSVEVAGGAKSPAQLFRPVKHCAIRLKHVEQRKPLNVGGGSTTANESEASTAATVKVEPKPGTKKLKVRTTPKKELEPSTSASVAAETTEKSSPESKKTTPEEKKPNSKAAASNKKGINSFFNAAANASNKAELKKSEKAVIKPPTPKKMQDFFKKQPELPPIKKESPKRENTKENLKKGAIKKTCKAANISKQLFVEADADSATEESSDEEEKLEALKRDIISSDHETAEDADPSTSSKRRRIIDSDDDEEAVEPQKKLEKTEQPDEEEAEMVVIEADPTLPASETFLDDDGFVITIKPKKPKPTAVKPRAKKISPPSKSVPKPSAKSAPPPPAKTKQGNIMSFFTKK